MDEFLELERDLAEQQSTLETLDFDERLLVPEEVVVLLLEAAKRRAHRHGSFEALALEILRAWALEPALGWRHFSDEPGPQKLEAVSPSMRKIEDGDDFA